MVKHVLECVFPGNNKLTCNLKKTVKSIPHRKIAKICAKTLNIHKRNALPKEVLYVACKTMIVKASPIKKPSPVPTTGIHEKIIASRTVESAQAIEALTAVPKDEDLTLANFAPI